MPLAVAWTAASKRRVFYTGRPTMAASSESEVLAQELSNMAGKVGALEARLKDVEAVINRLEGAAETTARALEEVSAHWDAVYRAMRRAE